MRFQFYASLLVVAVMLAVALVLLGLLQLLAKIDYVKDQTIDHFKPHYQGQHRRTTAI